MSRLQDINIYRQCLVRRGGSSEAITYEGTLGLIGTNPAGRDYEYRNTINQVVYDESTGGCYDGLLPNCINLNQGAESTISYLLARMSLGK